MIRDPIFGGIDWDGVRQVVFMLVCLFGLISLGAATSGHWYDPYVSLWEYVKDRQPYFLGIGLVLAIATYWWWQFETGRL